MLRHKVLQVTAQATRSEALRKITTGFELVPGNAKDDVAFIVFTTRPRKPTEKDTGSPHATATATATTNAPATLTSTATTPQDVTMPNGAAKAFFDPFDPKNLEEDLFVTQIHGTHNLVLNKFNVVEEHVVLPTIEFETQEKPLNPTDFRAMITAMRQLEAFAFYNCGNASGASQPHKHMQLMSYPSIQRYTNKPWPPLLSFIDEHSSQLDHDKVIQVEELPFCHFLYRLKLDQNAVDPQQEATEDEATQVWTAYTEILAAIDALESPAKASNGPTSYNLLLTSKFLLVVPRCRRSFEGIEVNSIGFVGSFLARTPEQRELLKRLGLFGFLTNVCFPKESRLS